MRIESTHHLVVKPQATYAKQVSVEVRMVDDVVECYVVCHVVLVKQWQYGSAYGMSSKSSVVGYFD